MKKNQNGFSVVEGLFVLAIVGLIGFASWYVWQGKNKVTDSKTASQTNTLTKNVTNELMGYSFQLPRDWKSYISNRFSDQPERGESGDLEPPAKNDAGQIIFQSTLNSDKYTLKTLKTIAENTQAEHAEEFEANGIIGHLSYQTKADPNINSLDIIFVNEKNMYRFVYEAKKEYTDYKKLPYLKEFLQTAKSFTVTH